MNDRIIELAKQAGFFIDVLSEPMRIGVFHQKIDKELKRFAELVRVDALEAEPAVEPVVWYDGRKFYATPSAAHMDCADIKELRPLYEAHQAQQPAPVQEPAYAFRRKGLDDFCTCSKERFDELSNKPHLFETTTFYAAPQAPQPAPPADVPMLTVDEIRKVSDKADEGQESTEFILAFARAIEQLVRQKASIK